MAQFKEPFPLSVLNLGLKRLPWNLSSVHYRKCISNWKKHGQLDNKQTGKHQESFSQPPPLRVRWREFEGFTWPHTEAGTCLSLHISTKIAKAIMGGCHTISFKWQWLQNIKKRWSHKYLSPSKVHTYSQQLWDTAIPYPLLDPRI